jgi:hypothetical protein
MLKKAINLSIIAIVSTLSLSASAYTYEQRKELADTCSYANDVSDSSVFGAKSNYQEKYPTLGFISAKIDKAEKILPKTRAKVDSILNEAKKNKDAVLYAIYKNDQMTERNRKSISLSEQSADMASRSYRLEQGSLVKENQYVSQKAVKDVKKALESDRRNYGSYGQHVFSSAIELKRCEEWWGF